MSTDSRATIIQTVIMVGSVIITVIWGYFTFSAKAEMALAEVQKIEVRVKMVEEKQAKTSADIAEMKADIRWIKDHLQKGR